MYVWLGVRLVVSLRFLGCVGLIMILRGFPALIDFILLDDILIS